MKRVLVPTSAFIRAAKRIAKRNRGAAAAIHTTLTALKEDAFDPQLKSHKLKGDLSGFWACSAAYDLRIVFEILKQEDQELILLASVGTHDEVY